MSKLEQYQDDRIRGLEMALAIVVNAVEKANPGAFSEEIKVLLDRYNELNVAEQLPGASGATQMSIGCALDIFGVEVVNRDS